MHTPTIGECDLLVTKHGTVHHLNLAPEQLADTVIMVEDFRYVDKVSRYFDHIEHKVDNGPFITHTGYLGKKRLSVVSICNSPGNTDIVLNELDALVNIDFKSRTINDNKRSLNIIQLGTCESLHADIAVNSLIVSSYGIGLDNLLHYYRYNPKPEETFILEAFKNHTHLLGQPLLPYIAESAISLRKHFAPGFIHSITISCPGFYAPQGRVLRAQLAFPHLLDALASFSNHNERIAAFEMTAASVYGLGKVLGHFCLSINTVIANRTQKIFTADKENAIDNMIHRSLEIIEQI